MAALKIWGTIIIVLGVMILLFSFYGAYEAYILSDRVESMQSMAQITGKDMSFLYGDINEEEVTFQYIGSFMIMAFGAIVSIIGTIMVSRKAKV